MNRSRNHFVAIVLLILVLLISACVKDNPAEETQEPVILTPPVEVTSTSIPTVTLPDKVILLLPAGSDLVGDDALKDALFSLVNVAGLEMIIKESLTMEELDRSVKVVFTKAGIPNLMELVNVRSGIQFVSLDGTELTPMPNLSVPANGDLDLQRQAFMAGYLASVITPDYRVGVLASNNDRFGEIATESFFVGAQYFCGLCNSRFGPIEYYPKVAYVADAASVNSWQPAVDLLLSKAVKTVFVQDELISSELLAYLFQNGLQVISPISNTGVVSSNEWLLSLAFNPMPGIIEVWPDLLAGRGGFTLENQIELVLQGGADISEGRLNLFRQTMDALMGGYIVPAATQ